MIRSLSFAELQQRFGGECYGSLSGFTQLETDSRLPLEGKVFLALKGERFDGHRFCLQAKEQGATGLVVSDFQPGIDLPQWCVADTRIALGQIALLNRELFRGSVIAITGNSGKTTVKEMLGSVLSHAFGSDSVLITAGNFNNDIGVPLTLLRLSAEHRFAVIELGASHLGEIEYCAGLARPDIGVVLNVTGAHLGEFGSTENIAQAKGELILALGEEGCAVINQDDVYAEYWRSLASGCRLTGYGVGLGHPKEAEVKAQNIQIKNSGYAFDLCFHNESFPVLLQVPARHNVSNALAAASAALQLGVSLQTIAEGLERFSGVVGRLQIVTGFKQSSIINDSYNANPGSVRAAIDTLMDFSGQHILILGDVGELGDGSVEAHASLGRYAREKGVEHLFTYGELTRHSAGSFGDNAYHFTDHLQLAESVKQWLTQDTVVLVKGSRSTHMEVVVKALSSPPSVD
ncbi:UDP-N-acetylmuramoyl-tripeptide--D-alanyl-D-alanine ligase [Oceanospirillum linum]|uniref:UDP-N-acetylmuramoyl-tripeptide--D-alanyl-D-alanine ligase n=1 Tax=Oceanospirillum linum TaxID=966 RepID=A0A1T1HEZ5_OCELI|nr:UDP-N-acetylmuramoyl-tripeptide--D-alanyl-D-alanine ligase [Oceanospirillum linum]OOV88429.1 hypothetical protein BTA35_0202660 [Oceanospirillum linum]SEF56073.1 UDP-N-acetylmuramoyl-tripeptide--D-alanyl-D-alanine ligase [Oleiphilus messinensis]SMP05382.1 UDP-N-acetylmuramoyl-tripeptide--D-alanyl-D-alanine ligase [Oceanospirillum linum]